jgi:hypothetical protein
MKWAGLHKFLEANDVNMHQAVIQILQPRENLTEMTILRLKGQLIRGNYSKKSALEKV